MHQGLSVATIFPYGLLLGCSIPFLRRLIPAFDGQILHASVLLRFYCTKLSYFISSWGPAKRPPTPFDTIVSAEWFTEVLVEQKVIPKNVRVTAAKIADLKGNLGLASTISRILVTYSEEHETFPKSFILKQLSVRNLYNTLFSGHTKEALFYEAFGEDFKELIPRCYYQNTCFGRMIVILEDLVSEKQAKSVNYLFGNQVWGVPEEMKVNAPDQLVVLKEVFVLAARWHAKFWRNPKLLRNSWLKASLWYSNQDRARWETAIHLAENCWTKCKDKIDQNTIDFTFSDKLRKIIDASFEHTSWENLQRHLNDPKIPFTLCHGDFHAGNLFWLDSAEANNKIRAVDFSEVGPWEPTTCLGQTIISDVRPEIWKGKEKELITIYWNELVRNGVDATSYPLDDCYSQYERSSVERWIWLLCILVSFPLPPSAKQYFHDQLLAFIDAHNHYEYYELKPVVCLPNLPLV